VQAQLLGQNIAVVVLVSDLLLVDVEANASSTAAAASPIALLRKRYKR
jgi:hypothetical protein